MELKGYKTTYLYLFSYLILIIHQTYIRDIIIVSCGIFIVWDIINLTFLRCVFSFNHLNNQLRKCFYGTRKYIIHIGRLCFGQYNYHLMFFLPPRKTDRKNQPNKNKLCINKESIWHDIFMTVIMLRKLQEEACYVKLDA